MHDLGGVPLNINGDGKCASSLSVVYGNLDILYEESLEVNGIIPNLMAL